MRLSQTPDKRIGSILYDILQNIIYYRALFSPKKINK